MLFAFFFKVKFKKTKGKKVISLCSACNGTANQANRDKSGSYDAVDWTDAAQFTIEVSIAALSAIIPRLVNFYMNRKKFILLITCRL